MRSSEDEVSWACLAILLAGMAIASGVWAWWSSEFLYGYLLIVLGVFGLLRAARHLKTAWDIETADREWRERRYREWVRTIREGRDA